MNIFTLLKTSKILQITSILLASYSWTNAQIYTPLTPHSIPYLSLTPDNMTNFSGLKEAYNIKDEDNDNVTIQINGSQNVEVKASNDIHFDGEWLVEPNASGNFYAHIEDPMFDLVWFTPNSSPGFVPRYEKLELGLQFKDEINQAIENYILSSNNNPKLNPFNPEDIEVKAEFSHGLLAGGSQHGYPQPPFWYTPQKVYGFYYKEFERDLSDSDPNEWSWNALEMTDQVNSKYNFRIRFAPPEYGLWKCKVSVTVNGYPLMEAKEFTFTCAYSTNHGYMKIGPNKRYFTIDDETYVPAGKNFPSPETDYNSWDDWTSYNGSNPLVYNDHRFNPGNFINHQNALKKYSETGGQFFRMMLFGSAFEIEHEHLNNYYDRMNSSWELDRFLETLKTNDLLMELNLQYTSSFQELEGNDVIYNWTSNYDHPVDPSNPPDTWGGDCMHCVQCQKKDDVGYCYHTELGLAEPYEFFVDADAKEYYKRRLRYIVSRWGYSTNITIFEMVNEISGIDINKGYYKYSPGDGCELIITDTLGVYQTSEINGQPLPGVSSVPAAISQWHHEMGGFLKTDQHFSQLTAVSYLLGGPDFSGGDASFYSDNIDVRTYNPYYGSLSGWETDVQRMYTDREIIDAIGAVSGIQPKPLYFAETGDGEYNECDNGISFMKKLWKPFFTGASGAGNTWYYRYQLDKNQKIEVFQDFVDGINFASINADWRPQKDVWSNNQVSMFALVSDEDNKRAIGVIDNKTVNYFTLGIPGTNCKNIDNKEGIDDELEAALNLEHHIVFDRIKLKHMGGNSIWNLRPWYVIQWVNVHSGQTQPGGGVLQRPNLAGKLVLEFPELKGNLNRHMVAFKVNRLGAPSFITAQDSLVIHQEEALIIADLAMPLDTLSEITITDWSLSNNKLVKVELMVSPNPASNYCEVSFSGELSKDATLVVYDSKAVIIYSSRMEASIKKINLESFSKGSYLVSLISNNKYYVQKLIIE